MESLQSSLVLLALAIVLVIFNSLLTREIYYWVPSRGKQLLLFLLVWCIPIIGFLLANKIGDLRWFAKGKSKGGSAAISGGLLQGDSIFNPGAKNTIEMVEKQQADSFQEEQVSGSDIDQDKSDRP